MPDTPRTVRLRLGRNVQRLRLFRKFSQAYLAELAGNTEKHIGQVERGETNVGIDIVARIAAALSVNVEELFSGSQRRRAPGFQLLQITERQLAQIEQVVRQVRAMRTTRKTGRRE